MTMTLSNLASELDEARRDAARYKTLQTAERRAAELSALYAEAKAQADIEDAERRAAAHEAQFAGITSIRVADASPPGTEEGLLHRRFRITYTRLELAPGEKASAPREHVVDGFHALPQPVLLYLLEKHPEQMPAAIMALSPDNAREALSRYYVARRRGHC